MFELIFPESYAVILSGNFDDETEGQSLFPMKHGTKYNMQKNQRKIPPLPGSKVSYPPTHKSDMLCTNSACETVFSGHNRLTAGLSAVVASPIGGSSLNSTSGR